MLPLTLQQRQSRAGLWVSLGVGLLCVATLLWPTGCAKRDAAGTAASRPAYRFTTVTTGRSMLPTFGEAEVVMVELCRFGDLRTGDTVIYWHDGTRQFVHHRLMQRDATDGRWLCRGDNNPGQDTGRFTADEFVGRTHKL